MAPFTATAPTVTTDLSSVEPIHIYEPAVVETDTVSIEDGVTISDVVVDEDYSSLNGTVICYNVTEPAVTVNDLRLNYYYITVSL